MLTKKEKVVGLETPLISLGSEVSRKDPGDFSTNTLYQMDSTLEGKLTKT